MLRSRSMHNCIKSLTITKSAIDTSWIVENINKTIYTLNPKVNYFKN